MFKYNVTNFKEFTKCMKKQTPVYIEKVTDNYPIPVTVGVIYPYRNNSDENMTIILCVYDDNDNINYSDFERMLINLSFSSDTKVKVYNENDSLEIYEVISEDCNLFVLDNLIERTEIIKAAPKTE